MLGLLLKGFGQPTHCKENDHEGRKQMGVLIAINNNILTKKDDWCVICNVVCVAKKRKRVYILDHNNNCNNNNFGVSIVTQVIYD